MIWRSRLAFSVVPRNGETGGTVVALGADDEPAVLEEHELRRLREFTEKAERRCLELRATLDTAEEFAALLRDRLARHTERARKT